MDKNQLLELKNQIEKASQEVNKLEGRKEHLLQQLEKDWECKTIPQARKKLEKMKEQIKELEQKIKEGISELEEKYEFK